MGFEIQDMFEMADPVVIERAEKTEDNDPKPKARQKDPAQKQFRLGQRASVSLRTFCAGGWHSWFFESV
jgi:hypothetical protein